MLKYFYPQWLGKTRYPKYTMNLLLWVPLMIFFACRFFYFRRLYFSAKKKIAAYFIKWTLLSYIFLTLGFLYFPLHSIDKFPNRMLRGWRAKFPKLYDFFSYDTIPYLSYLAFTLYLVCKWQAWKYHKKAVLQPQNGINVTIMKKDLTKARWAGNIFFLFWFWFLYCNTCVGWYFPFDWR